MLGKRSLVLVAVVLFAGAGLLFAGGQRESGSAPAKNGKVTLDFWTENTQPYQVDILKKIISQFESSNPNISITYELVPWSVYLQKFQTALQTKQTPAVSQLGTTKMPYFQKRQGLVNITSYVNSSSLKKDVVSPAWYTARFGSDYYGVPWGVDVRYTLYRKDLFQKAGLSMPGSSWTWQQFVNDAKKLTNAKKNVYGVGVAYGKGDDTGEQAYWSALQSAGGNVLSNNKVILDSPQAATALKLYTGLLTQDHVAPPSAPSLTGPDLASLMANGSIAMVYSNNISMYNQVIKADPSLKGKIGMAPNPTINGKSADFMGGSDLVMWTGHSKATYNDAWKWIQFLMSSNVQAEYTLPLFGALPAVKSAYSSSKFLAATPSIRPFKNVMLDAVKNGVSEPNITQLPVIEQNLKQLVNSAVLGTSIHDALKNAAQSITNALNL